VTRKLELAAHPRGGLACVTIRSVSRVPAVAGWAAAAVVVSAQLTVPGCGGNTTDDHRDGAGGTDAQAGGAGAGRPSTSGGVLVDAGADTSLADATADVLIDPGICPVLIEIDASADGSTGGWDSGIC
jgi:hypothetical protein